MASPCARGSQTCESSVQKTGSCTQEVYGGYFLAQARTSKRSARGTISQGSLVEAALAIDSVVQRWLCFLVRQPPSKALGLEPTSDALDELCLALDRKPMR